MKRYVFMLGIIATFSLQCSNGEAKLRRTSKNDDVLARALRIAKSKKRNTGDADSALDRAREQAERARIAAETGRRNAEQDRAEAHQEQKDRDGDRNTLAEKQKKDRKDLEKEQRRRRCCNNAKRGCCCAWLTCCFGIEWDGCCKKKQTDDEEEEDS